MGWINQAHSECVAACNAADHWDSAAEQSCADSERLTIRIPLDQILRAAAGGEGAALIFHRNAVSILVCLKRDAIPAFDHIFVPPRLG